MIPGFLPDQAFVLLLVGFTLIGKKIIFSQYLLSEKDIILRDTNQQITFLITVMTKYQLSTVISNLDLG